MGVVLFVSEQNYECHCYGKFLFIEDKIDFRKTL